MNIHVFILEVTDVSVSAILMNCNLLEEALLTGLKRITIQPFLPIIAGKIDIYTIVKGQGHFQTALY